jgi:hypothetical protein
MFFVLSLIGVCVSIKEKVYIGVSVSASGDLDFRAIFFFFLVLSVCTFCLVAEKVEENKDFQVWNFVLGFTLGMLSFDS